MKWNIAGLRNVAIVAAAVLVAACGGEEAPGDSNAGGTTPTAAPTVTITTTNSATGQPSNALTLSSPLNATATVRDAKGAPVANAIVQFTASASSGGSSSSTTAFVSFSPASANGITDANGNVTVVVSAGSVSSSGAGTLSASASVGDTSASSSAAIQVAQANICAAEPRTQPGDDCSIPNVDDHRCGGRGPGIHAGLGQFLVRVREARRKPRSRTARTVVRRGELR